MFFLLLDMSMLGELFDNLWRMDIGMCLTIAEVDGSRRCVYK